MKYIMHGSLLFFCTLVFTFPVQASSKIAVVDMPVILAESKAAKSIKVQVEKQQKKYQAQIAKQEEAIRSAEKALIKEKDTLSPEDFAEKRKIFEKKIIDAQKLVQKRRKSLDTSLNEAMSVLREEVAQIIANISADKGVELVLSRTNVVLASKTLDITEPVLKELDKKLTTVPVKWSDN